MFLDVKNYNEKEEATCIEIAMLLNPNYLNRILVVPFLSIITLMIFPLKLYWSKRMQAEWLYSRGTTLETSQYIFIVGRGNVKSYCYNFYNFRQK